VLRFDGEGHFSATACNFYSGAGRINGEVLHIGRTLGTSMGCGGTRRAVEEAFAAVVDGEVRWRIDGEELRLDNPGGRGLRFRVRDTIYPSRDLRPLLRGQRDGGDYRFGWQAGEAGIGLEFEWRDGPGKPWGSLA
jgi:predicted Rdx family selenoprotein